MCSVVLTAMLSPPRPFTLIFIALNAYAISFSDTVVYIYTVKYHYMYSKPAYNKFTITMKSASFLQVMNIS